MQCQRCAAQIPAGALFCSHCGHDLSDQPDAAGLAAAGVSPGSQVPHSAIPAAAALSRAPIPDVPEVTLWEASISPASMAWSWIFCGAATVLLVSASFLFHSSLGEFWWLPAAVAVGLDAVIALQFLAMRLSVHYKLTNQRLFQQRGILRRVTSRVEVIDIEDVAFEQTLLDRMFDVGRIRIASSDKSDPVAWLEAVQGVEKVFMLIDKARRQERLRRGISVESL